jgi:hypothetical protein
VIRRFAWSLALCGSTVIVAVNLVLGLIVAITLFDSLNNTQAGIAFGGILKTWVQVIWLPVGLTLAGLGILLLGRLFRGDIFSVLALGILVVGLVLSQVWVADLVNKTRMSSDKLRELERTPNLGGDREHFVKLKKAFDYYHRTSSQVAKAQTGIAALTLLLSLVALTLASDGRQAAAPAKESKPDKAAKKADPKPDKPEKSAKNAKAGAKSASGSKSKSGKDT